MAGSSKKLLLAAAAVAALLAIAAVAVLFIEFDSPELGRLALARIGDSSGLDLEAEGFRLNLLRGLEAHLGVEAGEATADGRVSLGHEECLGACGYAPMMRIDDKYYEDLDLEEAKRILDELD